MTAKIGTIGTGSQPLMARGELVETEVETEKGGKVRMNGEKDKVALEASLKSGLSAEIQVSELRVDDVSGSATENDVEPDAGDSAAMTQGLDIPALNSDVQRHLGRKLKASYEELIRQPVPDRFRQLLDQLARKEKSG